MLDWLRLFRVSGFATLASNLLAAVSVAIYANGLDYSLLGHELYRNAGNLIWVVLSACLLFAAGMAWNDIADYERDRRLNPRRPLPSGRIPLTRAVIVAAVVATGALLSGAMLGLRGFCMAGIVLSLSLLYNFATKHVPYLGSITMALVRASYALFCLLILGGTYFDRTLLTLLAWLGLVDRSFAHAAPVYPLLLACYVTGVTLISELETRKGRRIELILGGLLVTTALVIATGMSLTSHWMQQLQQEGKLLLLVVAGVLLVLLAFWQLWRFGRPFIEAVRAGRRELVTPILIAGLTGMVLFDGLIACAFHPLMGLAAVLLLGPFKLVARLVRMD